LPLRKSATIVHGNALRIDWQDLIDPMPWEKERAQFNYILGNPPFVGFYLQTKEQKADLDLVFYDLKNHGMLDYVSAWYVKACEYLKRFSKETSAVKVAFVSTNSITQGEQVGLLWNYLFSKINLKILFAHRTFKWNNEAKGNAGVYVVIIGFSNVETQIKRLYDYEHVKGDPNELTVSNITPYLTSGKNVIVISRSKPLTNVPEMIVGNLAYDGGYLNFTKAEKEEFLSKEPSAKKFFKKLIGAKEYLYNGEKWCLWLTEAAPSELREMPLVMERIKQVKKFREASTAESTRRLAATPALFRDRNEPNTFVLIPRTSSENRLYIPLGFFKKDSIVTDSCLALPNANKYHFGVLFSSMHMVWMKYTCGRLESRYRYSKDIVYNNFPWPESSTEKQIRIDARAQFPNSSLADLYDPNTMPPVLVKAHLQLDKAVDLCYRPQPFANETKRIEFLFELYDKYTAGLFVKDKKTKKKKENEPL